MVAQPQKPYISPEAYLAQERAAEFRSEYWNGEVVAMAGGSRNHNRIIRNLIRRLGNQLDGSSCEAFASETRVRVPECNVYFYPDILIVCDGAHYEDTEAETLLNPTVIMEVLSPGTEAADRGRKFACYRTLPSLILYVLIEQDAPNIDLYTRQADGNWLLTALSGLESVLALDPPSASLPCIEIYQAVEFPPQRGLMLAESFPTEGA
ncbi:MAG TPA: Uma2 family endonuclease [Chthonomonadaceae bacterium]|nr:Uma2 family endonuclease [Chthonomonadaceae bacterium]